MDKNYITLKHLLINEKKMIGLKFYPNKVIQAMIKTLPGVKWSNKYEMACIPNTRQNVTLIFNSFKGVAWINCAHFFPNRPVTINQNFPDIQYFKERKPDASHRKCPDSYLQKLEIRRYSQNTVRTYVQLFEKFLNYYKDLALESIDEQDIRSYLSHLVSQNKSDSLINQSINSIKFYYEVVMEMPNRFYSIERPMKKEKLPTVLDKSEVNNMINSTCNIKHRVIISLLYSAGLRRSELLNLTVTDIDSKRMLIKVRDGKGGKDRYTLLSNKILEDLRKYYREFKPKTYLIEGEKGEQYSETSVVKVVKNAARKHQMLITNT